MFLVRDIMFCKPGQARPMVQKFLALDTLGRQLGFGPMRVMTDVSAERYWTVVSEMEVESMEKYVELTKTSMELKEFQEAMKGYHDLVVEGRREIYSIEKRTEETRSIVGVAWRLHANARHWSTSHREVRYAEPSRVFGYMESSGSVSLSEVGVRPNR